MQLSTQMTRHSTASLRNLVIPASSRRCRCQQSGNQAAVSDQNRVRHGHAKTPHSKPSSISELKAGADSLSANMCPTICQVTCHYCVSHTTVYIRACKDMCLLTRLSNCIIPARASVSCTANPGSSMDSSDDELADEWPGRWAFTIPAWASALAVCSGGCWLGLPTCNKGVRLQHSLHLLEIETGIVSCWLHMPLKKKTPHICSFVTHGFTPPG